MALRGRERLTLQWKELDEARLELKRNKAGAPNDGAVAEWIHWLPLECVMAFTALFNTRMYSTVSSTPPSWQLLFLWLLPKETRA